MTGVDQKDEHRLRVRWGLTGLAFVFLFVLLGAAISRLGRDNGPALTERARNAARADSPDEPLAELGVAPSQSTPTNNPAPPTTRPAGAAPRE